MTATLTMLLAVLMSCSQVGYGYVDTGEAEHSNPSISEVGFSFNWNEMAAEDIPEDLTVVMSRIVNTVHYVYELDKDGLILGSVATMPGIQDSTDVTDSSWIPDRPVDPDISNTPSATDTILNGDYYVMALAQSGKQYKYTIDGVDQFIDSLSTSMKDLYARIPEVSEEEIVSRDIVDFNPLYPIIYPAEPLFLEVKKQSMYPQDEVNQVQLTPQSLVHQVTFRINLRAEGKKNPDGTLKLVEIDTEHGLKGLLSGVPSRIQLMSGVVTRENTCKVLFDMNGEEIPTDEETVREYVFTGKVNVLGLFPALKPGSITGPGILQIILEASVNNKKRVFFASINLKDTIEKADMMIQTDDHLGYRCVADAELHLADTLVVTENQIWSSGGNGLEMWYENEDQIHTEI